MSEDIRPFEEYKEMIKDMRKEEMIKGLYDLSARITKQDKEIERLNKCIKDDKENANEIMAEQQREIERLNNIIEKLEQENAVLKTLVVNKDKYSYGIR